MLPCRLEQGSNKKIWTSELLMMRIGGEYFRGGVAQRQAGETQAGSSMKSPSSYF